MTSFRYRTTFLWLMFISCALFSSVAIANLSFHDWYWQRHVITDLGAIFFLIFGLPFTGDALVRAIRGDSMLTIDREGIYYLPPLRAGKYLRWDDAGSVYSWRQVAPRVGSIPTLAIFNKNGKMVISINETFLAGNIAAVEAAIAPHFVVKRSAPTAMRKSGVSNVAIAVIFIVSIALPLLRTVAHNLYPSRAQLTQNALLGGPQKSPPMPGLYSPVERRPDN